MFKHLTKDASEGNRSVVCCQRFIALFEGRHDICLQPVSRELACLEGSIKYDFDDRSDLFTELSQQKRFELIWSSSLTSFKVFLKFQKSIL